MGSLENFLVTEEQAREWLDKHEGRLSEASCSGGWDYIHDNIDYPDLDECEECLECGEYFFAEADEVTLCPNCSPTVGGN